MEQNPQGAALPLSSAVRLRRTGEPLNSCLAAAPPSLLSPPSSTRSVGMNLARRFNAGIRLVPEASLTFPGLEETVSKLGW